MCVSTTQVVDVEVLYLLLPEGALNHIFSGLSGVNTPFIISLWGHIAPFEIFLLEIILAGSYVFPAVITVQNRTRGHECQIKT